MESSSHPLHLGRETPRSPRPGLCASSSAGRIRSDYPVRPPAPYSLGSLLSESRLMPSQKASDPLESPCVSEEFSTTVRVPDAPFGPGLLVAKGNINHE